MMRMLILAGEQCDYISNLWRVTNQTDRSWISMMEVRFWSGSGLYVQLQLVILRRPGGGGNTWAGTGAGAEWQVNFLSNFQNIWTTSLFDPSDFVGQQTGNVLRSCCCRRNTPECFNRTTRQNQVFGPRPQDVCSVCEEQEIQNLNQKFYVLKTERSQSVLQMKSGFCSDFHRDERGSASNAASRFNVTSLSLLVLVLIGQHRSNAAALLSSSLWEDI